MKNKIKQQDNTKQHRQHYPDPEPDPNYHKKIPPKITTWVSKEQSKYILLYMQGNLFMALTSDTWFIDLWIELWVVLINSRWDKTFCNCWRVKITPSKNNLVHVYIIQPLIPLYVVTYPVVGLFVQSTAMRCVQMWPSFSLSARMFTVRMYRLPFRVLLGVS